MPLPVVAKVAQIITAIVIVGSLVVGCSSSPTNQLASSGSTSASTVTLKLGTIGPQDGPAIEASGVLDGAPYNVDWAVFTSPIQAATALTSKQVHGGVGLGDTAGLQALATSDPTWTAQSAPYKTVSLFRQNDPDNYSSAVTVVGKDSGINSLSDLRGKKWAYNPGSNTNAMFLLTLKAAGLTEADVEPVQLDFTTGAQALASGDVDVWSGAQWQADVALSQGAKVLVSNADVRMPAYGVFAVRTDLFNDPAIDAALADFTYRLNAYYLWAQKDTSVLKESYQRSLKLTDEQAEQRAKYKNMPMLIDAESTATEQTLADDLHELGFLGKSVDSAVMSDSRYNSSVQKAIDDAAAGIYAGAQQPR